MNALTKNFTLFILTVITPSLLIGCALLKPHAARTEYLDYQTRTKLRLPFDGVWHVYWGGVKMSDNYHAASSAQRFAFDFVKIKNEQSDRGDVIRQGMTHKGSGRFNEEYFAFSQPILAPGDGTILSAVDGFIDERPNKRRSQNAFGNHIVIDHNNGEFSILAHLEQNSVVVKIGQPVESGDVIAQCGNSGKSTEPHLHYHLQNSPNVNQKHSGLPVYFEHYIANGAIQNLKMPIKGEMVSHDDSSR